MDPVSQLLEISKITPNTILKCAIQSTVTSIQQMSNQLSRIDRKRHFVAQLFKQNPPLKQSPVRVKQSQAGCVLYQSVARVSLYIRAIVVWRVMSASVDYMWQLTGTCSDNPDLRRPRNTHSTTIDKRGQITRISQILRVRTHRLASCPRVTWEAAAPGVFVYRARN